MPQSTVDRQQFAEKESEKNISVVFIFISLQSILKSTHFLYRILESKKTSRFQFSIPGHREIHRNLKQQKNFNSHDGFFRKSPFCTFSCINPGFNEPWGLLWIYFLNGTFIMLQKNTFGQKKFRISCTGSKVPFWKNWKIAKMALLNRCMKFKIFFGQKTSFEALWKCHLQKIFITFSRVHQIQDLGQSK